MGSSALDQQYLPRTHQVKGKLLIQLVSTLLAPTVRELRSSKEAEEMRVRKASHAGTWYEAEQHALDSQLTGKYARCLLVGAMTADTP